MFMLSPLTGMSIFNPRAHAGRDAAGVALCFGL